MILSFILKFWRRIVDIAVLLLIIALFFYFDPFNLSKSKLTTNSTANLVSGIKDIGQLVTAEYYGEVISSLKKSRYERYVNDSVAYNQNRWLKKIKHQLFDIYKDHHKEFFIVRYSKYKKAKSELVEELYSEYENSLDYGAFIVYLRSELVGRERSSLTKKRLNKKYLDDVVDFLFSEVKKRYKDSPEDVFNKYMDENIFTNDKFSEFSRKKVNKETDKDIAMIGRGWVKAGFNFQSLNEKKFFFDEEKFTVFVFGMKPEILDADINPWFVPENKIPGYQIVSSKGRVNFEDAKTVKENCRMKLREKAVEAGIIESAKKNGMEAIKNLISLLTNEEVKKVVFVSNNLDKIYDEISLDGVVSYVESETIDKVVKQYRKEIDSLTGKLRLNKENEITDFLNSVQSLKYVDKSQNSVNFNYYISKCNNIFRDGFLTMDNAINRDDSVYVTSLRYFSSDNNKYAYPDSLRENIYWFKDSLSYVRKYNMFVDYFNNKELKLKVFREKIYSESEYANLKSNLSVSSERVLNNGTYLIKHWIYRHNISNLDEFSVDFDNKRILEVQDSLRSKIKQKYPENELKKYIKKSITNRNYSDEKELNLFTDYVYMTGSYIKKEDVLTRVRNWKKNLFK